MFLSHLLQDEIRKSKQELEAKGHWRSNSLPYNAYDFIPGGTITDEYDMPGFKGWSVCIPDDLASSLRCQSLQEDGPILAIGERCHTLNLNYLIVELEPDAVARPRCCREMPIVQDHRPPTPSVNGFKGRPIPNL